MPCHAIPPCRTTCPGCRYSVVSGGDEVAVAVAPVAVPDAFPFFPFYDHKVSSSGDFPFYPVCSMPMVQPSSFWTLNTSSLLLTGSSFVVGIGIIIIFFSSST